jgi:hypothetical protein
MFNEKWQDIDGARGIDEISCDPPVTPPPTVNQPSAAKQVVFLHPHR